MNLSKDGYGKLNYTDSVGNTHNDLSLVRAFPISAPDEGISLLGKDGHELTWFANLVELPIELSTLIKSELAIREFMPVIIRIDAVSSFATPSTWTIATDRGDAEMVLKAEDQIRRLTQNKLLIIDGQGISFLIEDVDGMDRHSRKLLDRFL